MQVYSFLFSEKVSPSGFSDVERKDRREEEEIGREEEGAVEDERGEAVDVMMERRETEDEGVA